MYSIDQSNEYEDNKRSDKFMKEFTFDINSIDGKFKSINPDQVNKSEVDGKFNSVTY
jgi:hypothetical protein